MCQPLLAPEQLAFDGVAVQAMVAEVGVDPLPIGDGGLGGITILDVYAALRFSLAGQFLPQHFTGIKIKAEYLPAMDGLYSGPIATEIETFFRFLGFLLVDSRG